MRDTSHHIARQDSQQPKHFRGDEQKVMKKSLSLLLAIAMVFSMFAAVASAAETPQDRFDILREAGIFEGYPPNNDPGLNREMTRAEFSKVLALLTEAPSNPSANTYTDVPGTHWAAEYIGAVTAAGLMEGVGLNRFDPNGRVTVEQLAIVLARALGLGEQTGNLTGTYSPWAEGYIVAAIGAGLPIEGPNYKANALRSVLVNNAYTVYVLVNNEVAGVEVIDANNIEVTFTDGTTEEVVEVELATALVPNQATNVTVPYKGVDFVVSVTLTQAQVEASVAGAKKFEVKFNRAITETATFTVTLGSQNIPVTTTWDDEKKVATLTTVSNNNLVAGTYTVNVAGISEISQTSFELTVTAETLTSARLANTTVKPNTANAQVRVEGLNQYGEVMSTVQGNNFNWTVFNRTLSVNVPAVANAGGFTVNTNDAGLVRTGDQLVVTGVNTNNASVVVSATLVVSDAAMSELTFGNIVLPANETALNEKTTAVFYELPYTLKDGAGNTVTFDNAAEAAPGAFAVNGVNFTTDKADVITGLKVEDGKLFVKIAANKSGNVKLIATLSAVSKVIVKDISIAGVSTTDSIVLGAQPQTLTAGASVDIPVTVYDQYGAVIPAARFANAIGQFSLGTSNNSVANASFTADGKSLRVTGITRGTATITITNNNSSKLTTFVANVQDAANPTAFTTTVTANVLVAGQEATLKAKVTDQYGGEIAHNSNRFANHTFSVASNNAAVTVSNPTPTPSQLINDGVKLNGVTAGGSATITIELRNNGNLIQTRTVNIYVAESTATFNYKFKEDLTVYAAAEESVNDYATAATAQAFGAQTPGSSFAKTLEIVATDASGNPVAIPSSYVQSIVATGSNLGNVLIDGNKVIGKRWADSAETKEVALQATVQNPNGSFQVVTGTVTVQKATPTAASLKAFKSEGAAGFDGDRELAAHTVSLTPAELTSLDGANISVTAERAAANIPVVYFVVNDQYGVKSLIPTAYSISDDQGSLTTSITNAGVVTITGTPEVGTKVYINAVDSAGHNVQLVITVVAPS
ncbi:S-layer homology domain-containing protein [Paenibacillus sp. 1P07SE]|uniref:S-layer homology domain-containing protein n=1 Tax=Paenibacillus sp. 1P07SE TaxID=3132209 RepID=UPI0039A71C4C